MRTFIHRFLLCITAASHPAIAQNTYSVESPDKRISVKVDAVDHLAFSVALRGRQLMARSPISMQVEGRAPFGSSPRVLDVKRSSVRKEIRPVVREKRSVIPDAYELLEITFAGGFAIQFRAYDDGVAYRFATSLDGNIRVVEENVRWSFSPGDTVYFPEEESMMSHYERLYLKRDIAQIADSQLCSLPALVAKPNGVKLLLTEADISDYPGMFLSGSQDGTATLEGLFPNYPLEEREKNDRDVMVVREATYIAQTSGMRSFPWRVIGIAERDGDLLMNDIVYRLGKPLALKDTDWIRPGRVAWDWWNANNVYGVNFRSGVNTDTYKYFIDFASTYGIEYIILDEGWSVPADLFRVNPDMDIPALFAYAKEKNVGIIPWVLWNALEKDMDRALDQFAAWGAKGVKVDFMQRHDQRMVNFYERVAQEAAARKLLVDFHGAYKPDGLRRAYPNVITREGVRGGEWNKWSKDITPTHNLTIPFIRMAAGPMDYTPGATINANAEDFRDVFNRPMSMGTRCHQLAMYVVFESPLQMLCDNPSNYLREPETMEFLSAVPTVWDETRVLSAKIGEYVLIARRNADRWYVGGMTDWGERTFEIDFNFLGPGNFTMRVWSDGPNANRHGNDIRVETRSVQSMTRLAIRMSNGGGWVGILEKKAQ